METGSSGSEGKKQKTLTQAHLNQISVLKAMSENEGPAPRQFQITEIAERSGVKDEREIQRYLFILEGNKFVSPTPPGDFTSRTWVITKDGQDALRSLNKALLG